MAKLDDIFVTPPVSPETQKAGGGDPSAAAGVIDKLGQDELVLPRNMSYSGHICRLIHTLEHWKASGEDFQATQALRMLTVFVIRKRTSSRDAWYSLLPETRQIISDWTKNYFNGNGLESVDEDLEILATQVIFDFVDENSTSKFDRTKFMKVIREFVRSGNPKKQMQAMRMYIIFIEALEMQADGDLEFVVQLIRGILAENPYGAHSEAETLIKREAIILLTVTVSKIQHSVKVSDHGILELVTIMLEAADRCVQQNLIIEICNLILAGIAKFDRAFEAFRPRICFNLLGHISARLSSQLLVLSCTRVISRVFASNRSIDLVVCNGTKLMNTVHRLLMKGLEVVERSGCVQIYEQLGENPYLDAGIGLLIDITAQTNTKYDMLLALDRFCRPKPENPVSKVEKIYPVLWSSAVNIFLASCMKQALVDLRQDPWIFPQYMAKIVEQLRARDPLGKSVGRYALFEITLVAHGEDFLKPFTNVIVTELKEYFKEMIQAAQHEGHYWQTAFERTLSVLRIISQTPEFKAEFQDIVFMFGQTFMMSDSPIIQILTLRVFSTLVRSRNQTEQLNEDYLLILGFLKRYNTKSIFEGGDFQVVVYLFELLEAMTRTMGNACIGFVTQFYSWALESLEYHYPTLRKAVYSWFGSLNAYLASLIGKTQYSVILDKMINTLIEKETENPETILPDSGFCLTPPEFKDRSGTSSPSSNEDLSTVFCSLLAS